MAYETLDFGDAELIEIPVKIKGESYLLREATGGAGKKFTNARTNRLVLGPDGKPAGVKDVGDLEPFFVALCLFYNGEDKNKGKNVPQSVIESWPARVQKELFEKAKEISNLDETEDPLKSALEKALALPDSPTTLVNLREWVNKLEGDEYKPLKELLKPSIETKAKNEPSGTTAG